MGARGRGQRGTASRSHLIVGAGVSQRGWGGSWSPEDEMRSAEGKRPKRGPGRVLGKGVGEGRSPQPLGLWTSGSQMGKLPLGRGACLESLGRGCGPASLLLQHTWCGPAPGLWLSLRPHLALSAPAPGAPLREAFVTTPAQVTCLSWPSLPSLSPWPLSLPEIVLFSSMFPGF